MRSLERPCTVSTMRVRAPSRQDAFDAAVVVFAIGACEFESWKFGDVPGPKLGRALPVLGLLALPLVWRRTRPLLASVLVLGGLVAFSLAYGSPEGLEVIVPVGAASYAVSAHSRRPVAYVGLAVLVAGYAVYAAQDANIRSGRTSDLWAGAFFGVAVLAVWLLGVFLRGRRDARLLEQRAADVESEAMTAVSEERARMARELHDIVSHNLSVVVVQAAGARASGTDTAALEKIERSGREALVEMRRLLGVLREDGNAPNAAPQPGVAQLRELAATVQAAGLPVDLRVEGPFEQLPAAVSLTVYRIVQEALTNALKHAGAATVDVQVSCTPSGVSIDVTDDGRNATENGSSGMGHGLVGMRERVALFGGELRVGPRPGGGYAVAARLPLDRETA
jgi:signal transduction histidine kinase